MYPPASTAPGTAPGAAPIKPKRTLAQMGQSSRRYEQSDWGAPGYQAMLRAQSPAGLGGTPAMGATGASPHVQPIGGGLPPSQPMARPPSLSPTQLSAASGPVYGPNTYGFVNEDLGKTLTPEQQAQFDAAHLARQSRPGYNDMYERQALGAQPQGFAGMDPAGSIDPQQAKSQIEAALGFQLSPEQLQEAIGVSGWNGSGPFTGAHYNAVMQAAASRTGNQFSPYAAPAQTTPGATPNPQDQYNRAPLQLPVSDAPALNVPDLQLPGNFQSPTYQAPADFESAFFQRQNPFQAPTGEDAKADPGYDFALRESMRAIENSKAAGGALRTPGARDAIMQRAGDFATQRYGDVYNRRVGEYGMERQGNLDAYNADREGAIDQYDRRFQAANTNYDRANQSATEEFDRGVSLGNQRYDAGFQNAIAHYEPSRATWDARLNATHRANEVNYDGDWQSRLFGVDDQYRRQRDTVGDARYQAEFNRDDQRYGRADWWRSQDPAEQRRQFLASLGLSAS
jgi:hypothetical protein